MTRSLLLAALLLLLAACEGRSDNGVAATLSPVSVDEPERLEIRRISSSTDLSNFGVEALGGSSSAALALHNYFKKNDGYDGDWLRIAAENGDAYAMSDYALFLVTRAEGRELKHRALFWLRRAEKLGMKNASSRIAEYDLASVEQSGQQPGK